MFLERIAHLGLLKHDPEWNTLSRFPYPVQKAIITEILPTLLPPPPSIPLPSGNPSHIGVVSSSALFPAASHVKWVMEVVGAAFSLPAEDWPIASQAAAVYTHWLLEPTSRPSGVNADTGLSEQIFWQMIFKQASLLFAPRIQLVSASPALPHAASTISQTQRIPTNATAQSIAFTVLGNASFAQSATSPTNAPAENPQGALQGHIELCLSILKVFTTAARRVGHAFSEDTWIVLLKCMLGITDGLLRDSNMVNGVTKAESAGLARMADALSEHLLRVLFELWLRAKVRQIEMWDHFKSCFKNWTHRSHAIRQWNATTFALTQKVIRLLYGTSEGSETVNVTVNGFNAQLELPPEFAFNAWHRIIYMLGEPTILLSPIFTNAIQGISRMVDSFHAVGANVPPIPVTSDKPRSPTTPAPPDGNTLLHMFGSWLYKACSNTITRHNQEYEIGRAEAFGILCRIFCRPQRRNKFLATYIEQFYAVLTEGLRSDACLPMILVNTTDLFATDLEAVRMLVPDFIAALTRVLPKPIPELLQLVPIVGRDDLCFAAMRVLATLMCVPNHLERVRVRPGWDNDLRLSRSTLNPISVMPLGGEGGVRLDEDVTSKVDILYSEDDLRSPGGQEGEPGVEIFRSLKGYLLEIILTSLASESLPRNARYLLHLINVYVFEDATYCPGIVGIAIKAIVEKLLSLSASSPEVSMTALGVLTNFVELFGFVKRDSKTCARELVLSLCQFIESLMRSNSANNHYFLIVHSYECMTRWLIAGQWVTGDSECQTAVISALCKGVNILEPREGEDSTTPGAWSGGMGTERKKRNAVDKLLFGGRKAEQSASSSTGNLLLQGQQPRPEELAIKHAAQVCLAQFVNELENFPPCWMEGVGASRISTLYNDDVIRAKEMLAKHKTAAAALAATKIKGESLNQSRNSNGAVANVKGPVRYYLIDRLLVGFVELPRKKRVVRRRSWRKSASESPSPQDKENAVPLTGPARVGIVLRDATGKYSWASEMCYLGHKSSIEQTLIEDPDVLAASSSLGASRNVGVLPAQDEKGHAPPMFSPPVRSHLPECRSMYPRDAPKVIPSVAQILKSGEDTSMAFDFVKKAAQTQNARETERFQKIGGCDKSAKSYKAKPPSRSVDLEYPHAFRLFLSSMGFLSVEQQHRIVPLQISDALIHDIEHLDSIKERECITAMVLYARSGCDTVQDMLVPPNGVSEEFQRFVRSLGWPVSLQSHHGFNGGLTPSVCETAPYFANQACELMFHVPYLMKSESGIKTAVSTKPSLNLSSDSKRLEGSGKLTGSNDGEAERRSSSMSFFRRLSCDDAVAVVWIEDAMAFEDVPRKFTNEQNWDGTGDKKKVSMKTFVWLFVHPLVNTDGLYLIRIILPSNFTDTLAFGPLVDKSIVSRHTLGVFVRNTVISAYMKCKRGKDGFLTNSYAARWQCIDDMVHRNKVTIPLSEFYSGLFK